MKDSLLKSSIELVGVSHIYGDTSIFNNLTLSVKPGEFVVLVGPSGCGKTTLLNILSGHLKPSQGTILRKGVIRTVYQQDSLFPWLTVAENIGMGLDGLNKKDYNQNLKDLLGLIHLTDFKDHYPHELSGGMRQRVELARALAGDSDILLMDEPFCSLDYQTRLRLRQELILLLKKRPRTVVFVTHDIEEAVQLADRILILSPRPTTISRELTLKVTKPRDPANPLIIEAFKVILKELGHNASSNSNLLNSKINDSLPECFMEQEEKELEPNSIL